MASSEQDRAREALEHALDRDGATDPRGLCRERLRDLKEGNRGAYEEAVRHYEEIVVPGIASGALDALDAWTEYARRLAELIAPGRTAAIDESGRALPYEPGSWREKLVLHLPHAGSGRALLVALPREPSEAQRATCEWLVLGRQKLPEAG
jgi:hypothetical protein